ncbi:MAG TPA: radical SAM protein, partial [Desulfobacterales bacterium]|nr:radical SAM protein [Desulfobacterales bacterium]
TMDRLVELLVEAGLFHVVLSGGEPFLNFEVLEYGFRKLREHNISFSCNSNLMLTTEDRIKRLVDTGLDHILTSFNSYKPEVNDYMVQHQGAYHKIIKGIETAVRHGIRVSVNMIISKPNIEQVYETAKMAHNLGCQKIFATRTVPPVSIDDPTQTDFLLERTNALFALEQLVRAKEDTGIMIGTLVSYPLCLLEDLEKFRDFVGRGCPAQSGHSINISVNGETHACVHQQEGYGNIFEIGIPEAYKKMRPWHTGEYRNPECEGCEYYYICKSGCRSSAHAYYGKYQGPDQLMTHKDNISKPFKLVSHDWIFAAIEKGARFTAPKRLRFREETGFYLVNIRWANSITCPTEEAMKLKKFRDSGEEFSLEDFGVENKVLLAQLYAKDAVESKDIQVEDLRKMAGLSANITGGEKR